MSTHPAARQYVARHARLSWSRSSDESAVLTALHRAHMKAAGDWISFDRYLFIGVPRNDKDNLPLIAPVSGRNFVCKGPEFLLRAYAKSLETIGETPKLAISDRPD